MEARHLTTEELEDGLPEVAKSPADNGELLMISRRPAINERDLLDEGELNLKEGLAGDNWISRGQSSNPPREPNPEAQLTLMNSRAADLICVTRDRWPLAGDQLYVDLDIGPGNAPAGTHLQIGEAIIEVTAEPHTGCKKFVERFGMDAMTFVNSPKGKEKCTRGINTKVIQAGAIRVGDRVTKV